MPMNTLPPVGRIQGAVLEQGRTPGQSAVLLQYIDHSNESCELRIPFLDAMYLLNLLRGMEKDAGFESSNRPPS
jgi:hypothetical protein